MEFKSAQLGPLDLNPNLFLTFPQGIPGFEHCHQWELFHEDKDSPIILWLQAVDDPNVTLNLVDPALLGVRYEIALSDDEVALLQLQDPKDIAVLLVVGRTGVADRTAAEAGGLRANTQAPIIINTATRHGLQKAGLNCDIVFRNPQ